MGIKKNIFLLLFFISCLNFISCDDVVASKIQFRVQNNASQDISIEFTQDFQTPIIVECTSGFETILFEFSDRLQNSEKAFGHHISSMQSFKFVNLENDEHLLVPRPEEPGHINENEGIGTARETYPNDIYNISNWQLEVKNFAVICKYTINEEDLTLFE